jgi:hypothetical protein
MVSELPFILPHGDGLEIELAGAVDHLGPAQVADAGDQLPALTAVDHGDDVDAFGLQVDGGAQPVVVVGEDGNPLTRLGAPAVRIGAKRARQHDAGPVVVLEGDGAFGRAARQDRAGRIDAPQHLPGLACGERQGGR